MGPIPTAEPEVKKMYILFVKRMGRVKTSHDNVRIFSKPSRKLEMTNVRQIQEVDAMKQIK